MEVDEEPRRSQKMAFEEGHNKTKLKIRDGAPCMPGKKYF